MFIIVVYMMLTRIFGHSATDIQIISGAILLLGGLSYRHESRLSKIETLVETKFSQIENNISEIKQRLPKKK